jgi:hypothetical protein
MSKARDLANAGTALTTVSATELGYLDGVTSAVQTQIDAKQATVSGVDSTEIGYLDGVTSAIQTQINSKIGQSTAINPSTITAKGDLIVGTGAGTFVAQGVGSNGQLLSANSAQADGVEWINPPASGSLTFLASVSASGTSFGFSGISQSYRHLQLRFINVGISSTGNPAMGIRVNGITASVYVTQQTGGTNSGSQFNIGGGNTNATRNSGIVNLLDYSNTTVTAKVFNSTMGYFAGASGSSVRFHGGACTGNNSSSNVGIGAISSIQIVDLNTYTYNTGTVELYGVN